MLKRITLKGEILKFEGTWPPETVSAPGDGDWERKIYIRVYTYNII